jgi:beta-glucanase (GH16 family)
MYGFGKYRANMKLDQTPGAFMAFFTFKGPIPDDHNEIDIEILEQGSTTTAYFNTAYQGTVGNGQYVLPFDPSAAYHTYAFDWYPDHIDFFVDDMTHPVWTSYKGIPQEPSYLLFNTHINTLNYPDIEGINTLYVDWVTVEPVDIQETLIQPINDSTLFISY